MSRVLCRALLVGAVCFTGRLPMLAAQRGPKPAEQATVTLTMAGQPVILANAHVARMPKDLPVAPTGMTGGPGAAAAAPAKPGELAVEFLPLPDAITSQLADNQKCVKDKKGEACLLEGSVALLGPGGLAASSYVMHGASIKDLSLKGHAGDTAGRAGKVTIKYAALEMPVASAPATVTTTSAATLDTPAKTHKSFGKFVVGLVKNHGLQIVEVATGMAMMSMMVKNFSMAKGANGQLTSGSQNQLASLAQMINTKQGKTQYNIGAPPAGLGYGAGPAAQQAYLAMVRQQLVAKGADTSKFTLTTGAPATGTGSATASSSPAVPTVGVSKPQ